MFELGPLLLYSADLQFLRWIRTFCSRFTTFYSRFAVFWGRSWGHDEGIAASGDRAGNLDQGVGRKKLKIYISATKNGKSTQNIATLHDKDWNSNTFCSTSHTLCSQCKGTNASTPVEGHCFETVKYNDMWFISKENNNWSYLTSSSLTKSESEITSLSTID